MKTQTFISRQELLAAAAVVAAHSSAQAEAFRQKDVLFLFELFSNWCQSGLWEEARSYQNTQLARYLSQLTKEGYAKKSQLKSHPAYRLTRSGLIELLYRISNRTAPNPEQFLFSYYFISNYKERLINLVKEEGNLFPPALKVELIALLDNQNLLEREKNRIKKIHSHMKQRVSDAIATADLTEACIRKGLGIPEIVKLLQREHPYELNNQKPLSELVEGIPPDQRHWEIGEGAMKRGVQLWKPMLRLIENYSDALNQITR